MKLPILVPVVLLSSTVLIASTAFAQNPAREAIIGNITFAFARTVSASNSPGSPLVKLLLAPARQANPRASNAVWAEIAKEVASAQSKLITEKGGALDVALHAALQPMSLAQLKRLDAILNDPVYIKFEARLAAPSTQRRLFQASMGNAMRLGAVLNGILAKHGLNEVH